jgi:hypothetical protein
MMLKNLILLVLLLPSLAYGHGAPVFFSGTTVKWIPAALQSAGMCKLDASGVMTSGQADLTSNVTGVLPLANGGTNKNMTAANGGLVYSDADSLEVTAAGTSGQAVVSGGAGAPTFYAPTVGSVLFAGASGVLSEDNSSIFFDDTNNRLGIGTAVPSGTLDLTNVGDSLRGNLVLWGQGRAANSEWLLYDSPIGELTFYNPAQAVYGFGMKATGGIAAGPSGFPSDVNFGIKNNAGEVARHSLAIQKMTSQTGDFIRLRDTDNTTVLAKIDIAGAATFNGVTSSLTGNVTGNADTATALAANPSDCASDTYATTIAASGNLTCASITNASTTASALAGNSTIVLRDGSGNFAAGTITAALTGNASTATALAANPADCSVGTKATAIAANGDLTCSAASLTADVSGVLPLANGGTNKNMTAVNGGVVWTDADSMEVIAAGTSGQILQSNGAAAPSWVAAAGSTLSVVTKTADYTVTNSEDVILCNATAGTPITITMHSAATATAKAYRVKNIGADTCTVAPNGSDTFDGDTSILLPSGGLPKSGVELISNGSTLWSIF